MIKMREGKKKGGGQKRYGIIRYLGVDLHKGKIPGTKDLTLKLDCFAFLVRRQNRIWGEICKY